MNFSSMKVGSRLALGFSTLIVIGIVVAVFGRIQLERLADEVQLLVDDRMVKVEQITEAINNINLIARSVRNIALTSDHQEMEEEKNASMKPASELQKFIRSWKNPSTPRKAETCFKKSLPQASPTTPQPTRPSAWALPIKPMKHANS